MNITHIAAAELEVRSLYGHSLDDVLDTAPRLTDLPLLRSLRCADPRLGIEIFVRSLLDDTVPGGCLDPARLGADVPWLRFVGHLATTAPGLAAHTAGRFAGRLNEFVTERVPVAVPVMVAAHFTIEIVEHLAGHPDVAEACRLGAYRKAKRRSRRPGLGYACYVRAAKLVMLLSPNNRSINQ